MSAVLDMGVELFFFPLSKIAVGKRNSIEEVRSCKAMNICLQVTEEDAILVFALESYDYS